MKKLFKLFVVIGAVSFIGGLALWMGVRQYSIIKAEKIAQDVVQTAYTQHSPETEDEKLIAITSTVFQSFQATDPYQDPILKLRGYLTNKRLPGFIRLPSGVIETHIQRGECDNASRMLSFILEQEGIESVQWNMISRKGGHSALLVSLPDNRAVLADPFYGYMLVDEDRKLLHPNDAKNILKNGTKLSQILKPLSEKSIHPFYKELQNTSMGAEGEPLVIEADIPSLNGSRLVWGEINGEFQDVKTAAKRQGLTPYWYYVGHKYNREWVRILSAKEDITVKMQLMSEPDNVLETFEPTPEVNGKTLSWQLKAGEQIKFKDGLAHISFKRMNSYIGVDQIEITPAHGS